MSALKQPLFLIAAVAQNGVIGRANDLPWRFPEDLRYFKQKTLGHPVIMGRKNWESLRGRPLPGRPNLVVSRQANLPCEGARLFNNLDHAIAMGRMLGEQPPYIIGGAEIYRQALPLVTRMYLTDIPLSPDGDVFYPPFAADEWHEDGRWKSADGQLTFRVLERNQ